MKYSLEFLIDDSIGRLCSTIQGLILRPGELAGPQPTPADIARLREALQKAGTDWVKTVDSAE